MSLLVQRAMLFAEAAHKAIGQKRKYTNEPYFIHPVEVVSILTKFLPRTPQEVIAAAYLHDVVEDTCITLEDIEAHFGKTVASYVEQLTDVSKPSDGNRATRKRIDREHTAKCHPLIANVKLADLISNSRTIVKYDKEFAKT